LSRGGGGVKTFLGAKIHGIRVTEKHVTYNGSVAVDRSLLEVVGIEAYEQVHVVNLTNGQRWITYVLPSADAGIFALNGGGARLGEVGDVCVLMAFDLLEEYAPAFVLHLNERNEIERQYYYGGPPDANT
jgi:aspartate 1-decarboxylase